MKQKTKNLTLFLYQHRFVRYLFVGGTTFLLDELLLFTLHHSLGFNVPFSTSVAYWLAIIYNFLLNRFWTFSLAEMESLRRHLASYSILLGFNYLFTVIFVSLLSHHGSPYIPKAIAVAIQVTWTYPIYKHYIFVKTN